MTLQQLRLTVETAAAKSISMAAEKLGISQPNASQSLKNLETELGYPIFQRSKGGVTPTEEGYRFLIHAGNILKENDAIRSIGEENTVPRLHIGVMNYSPVTEAFIQFCSENRDAAKCDLSCINVSPEKGAVLLKNHTIDMMVSLQLKASLSIAEKLARENHFLFTKLAQIPICVSVRKDHPLIVSGELDGSGKGFSKLSNYPYAEYKHLEHMMPATGITNDTSFGYSYKIYVDERETRLRIVSETNAYRIGSRLSQERMDYYGLVSIPIGSEEATLVSVIRKEDEKRRDIKRFTELLLAEIGK